MLQIFGTVNPPPGVTEWANRGGLIGFLTAILRLMVVVGGIWVVVNIIVAGYQFIGAGGNSEKITAAWARIWQSLLGLLFIAGAFVLAAIAGQVIFGDPMAIIKPRVYGPR